MTENQEKAYENLQRWEEARYKLKRLEREEDALRASAENINSSQHVETGWTGRMLTGKRGKKEKEMAPILLSGSEPGNKRQEEAHCLLADKSQECDDQFMLCSSLYRDTVEIIEKLIDDEIGKTILILKHLSGLNYTEIGKEIRYSGSHTRRLYYKYLEEFGKGVGAC